MASFNYMKEFLKLGFKAEDFFLELDKLSSAELFTGFFMPFYCRVDINELFAKNDSNTHQSKLLDKKQNIQLFEFTFRHKQAGEKISEKGNFFVYSFPEPKGLGVIATIENSAFFDKGLSPWIWGMRPNLMTTFIPHKRLYDLIYKYRELNQVRNLVVSRASFGWHYHAKKPIPTMIWPQRSLEEVGHLVSENNGWFKSLAFKYRKEMGVDALTAIYRWGIVKTDKYFQAVFHGFIKEIAEDLFKNVKQYESRGRRENKDMIVRPIKIKFDEEKFVKPEDNKVLIDALRQMEKSTLAVLHGNPYIYLSVLDYTDGSSFDLWVMNSDELVIVPQLKCSVPSLERLVNHVFDSYSEGQVLEYSEEG